MTLLEDETKFTAEFEPFVKWLSGGVEMTTTYFPQGSLHASVVRPLWYMVRLLSISAHLLRNWQYRRASDLSFNNRLPSIRCRR
jgi:hypothetical protein